METNANAPTETSGIAQRVCLVGTSDCDRAYTCSALDRPAGTREALPGTENPCKLEDQYCPNYKPYGN